MSLRGNEWITHANQNSKPNYNQCCYDLCIDVCKTLIQSDLIVEQVMYQSLYMPIEMFLVEKKSFFIPP